MKLSAGLSLLASLLVVSAQSPTWGQCGGKGWAGSTSCVSGSVCTFMNDYYSQCIPGAAPPASTANPPSSTATATPTSTVASPPNPTAGASGFVKISGQKFTLNGSPFTVVGTNSYWVGLTGLSTTNMANAFGDIANAGLNVVRTWGFNDVTTNKNGVYYQSWSGSTPTVNTGTSGLVNFDNVVAAAKAKGLRLIVALTNNWGDYGGMDVYVNQIVGSGQGHDLFYTNSAVKNAYKQYVNAFVSRYKNEPTIMAWELSNEPRCKGSTSASTGSCTTATVTAWVKEMSAYIKSIDSNHLVAIGDEGFYNQANGPNYPYQGSEGVDFDVNLAVSSVDFGTFHAYPESWGQSANSAAWGVQWIKDHAASQKKQNKPVLLEEFGVTTNQAQTYQQWYNAVETSGLTGDLIWQAGSHLSSGNTPDDGYAIYPDDPVYPLFKAHVANMKARG